MKPTTSPNGTFITFIVENESKPVFYAHSKTPFEALANLPKDWSEEEVKNTINFFEQAYELGFQRGKDFPKENAE